MKIAFITNIVSLHQMELWDNFVLNKDVSFSYVYTLEHSDEYKRYYDKKRGYCIYSKDIDDIEEYLNKFDLFILTIGCVYDDRINNYLRDKDNIFVYSEHLTKNLVIENIIRKYAYIFKRKIKKRMIYRNISRNAIILATSSHAGFDYHLTGFKKRNIFKFGYFPHYSYSTSLVNNLSILFSGRNLVWKHPEDAFFAYEYLSRFKQHHLYIVGLGFEREKTNNITIFDEIDHDEVIKVMKNSELFIFASTREEGWGVVLPEAMASGCFVIANIYAGSTRFLVKNGYNGYTYKNRKQFEKRLKQYNNLSIEQKNKIRLNAINTIKDTWNPEVAASRLYELCFSKINNEKFRKFKNGPLSKDHCRF